MNGRYHVIRSSPVNRTWNKKYVECRYSNEFYNDKNRRFLNVSCKLVYPEHFLDRKITCSSFQCYFIIKTLDIVVVLNIKCFYKTKANTYNYISDPPKQFVLHEIKSDKNLTTVECKVIDSNPVCATVWEIDDQSDSLTDEEHHSIAYDNTSIINYQVSSKPRTISCRPVCAMFPLNRSESLVLSCKNIQLTVLCTTRNNIQ